MRIGHDRMRLHREAERGPGPGPRARHGARSFEPDSAYCQRLLGAVYRESGGAIAYQGDWHTHPHGAVEPSEL